MEQGATYLPFPIDAELSGDKRAIAAVHSLLRGSTPSKVDSKVEEANAQSRSKVFAAREDSLEHNPNILRNCAVPVYVEAALKREKGSSLTNTGALAVFSGAKTGRSPKDKRVVAEPTSEDNVWWGPVNIKMSPESFMINRERAIDYLRTRDQLYVVDAYAGWDPAWRIPIRIVTERAYHALFMKNMLVEPTKEEADAFTPAFTILNAGCFPANRYTEGMTSSCSVDLHLGRGEMVILGTQYAGEMKKGILTLMMYQMPLRNQLPLHSAANEDPADGSVTLFFGLSGTGKTTLSADPNRSLIGDDEHVWTETGVFNVEGGCYAKCANLSADKEPEIYAAVRFGAVVENVVFDEVTRAVDYDDISITENTRCAYELGAIPNAKLPALGHHPRAVVLLTCDGFGVLPPVSKLTKEQVIYHFISGYTSKMAGTEEGITQPVATFSACYGEPFLVWHPIKYAEMLAARLEQHGASAYLLNTGWVGGSIKGQRCPLKYTRAIVDAINSGELAKAPTRTNATFGLQYPTECAGVPSALLDPESSWADKAEYDAVAGELAQRFRTNFQNKYEDAVSPSIVAAGPSLVATLGIS